MPAARSRRNSALSSGKENTLWMDEVTPIVTAWKHLIHAGRGKLKQIEFVVRQGYKDTAQGSGWVRVRVRVRVRVWQGYKDTRVRVAYMEFSR